MGEELGRKGQCWNANESLETIEGRKTESERKAFIQTKDSIDTERKELETRRTGWDEETGLKTGLKRKDGVETKGLRWNEGERVDTKRRERTWKGRTWHLKERAETKWAGLGQKGEEIGTLKRKAFSLDMFRQTISPPAFSYKTNRWIYEQTWRRV